MNRSQIAYYGNQMRSAALSMYASHGPEAGSKCAAACLREVAEALAEMEGRERAVAMLDDIASATLARIPLADMSAILRAPTVPPAPVTGGGTAKPKWWKRSPDWQRGLLAGIWVTIAARAAFLIIWGALK